MTQNQEILVVFSLENILLNILYPFLAMVPGK